MSKHTPGRLFLSELPVGERDGKMAYAKLEIVAPSQDPRYLVFSVARIEFSYEQKHKGFISTSKEEAEANARRLVACWNACEGMATDALEQISRIGWIAGGKAIAKAEAILAATEPSYDDWIPWKGGECPVGRRDVVMVKGKNGEVDTDKAHFYDWHHTGSPFDIVAYRVVKP